MKKFLLNKVIPLLILVLTSVSGSAQNIVLNPDFELFSICPTANGDLQNASNWLDVVYSSDYVNCAYQGWTSQAVIGAQSGLGYAGFATYGNSNGAAESFGQFLGTPLIAGNSYRLNFFAKRSNSGFYSSVCTGLCFYGFNGNPASGGAQTNICTGSLPGAMLLGCSDTVSDVLWQPYSIDFIAPAALDFLVISPGCALNCAEYIYIDNINLVELINYANVCFGDTTAFFMDDTTSLVSASWSFSDPASGINNSSALFNPVHVFTSPGTFLVRVIRTYVSALIDTVIIPVTIYPQVSVNLGNDTTICQGESLTLDASGPGITSYYWQDGSANSSFVADTSGVYYVMVSNAGCSSSDTLNLAVIPCSAVSAGFQSADSLLCPGTCTDFNNLSVNASSWVWTFTGANPPVSTDFNPTSICYYTPGSYNVQLIASDGINSDTLLLLNYVTVYPFPPPQGISQSGDTLFANQGSISYQWYLDGILIPGATGYFYIALQSGDYNVVCTDGNGCEVEAAIFNVIAGIKAVHSDLGDVRVYPNPADDVVNISAGLAIRSATICNSLGEIIDPDFLGPAAGTQTAALDIHSLAAGMYWLEINAGGKIIHVKFFKSAHQ